MKRINGQIMILTVMLLTGAILGATTLASLLLLNQFHQTTDIKGSNQAIFAADSGIECGLYKKFKDSNKNCGEMTPIQLSNQAQYRAAISPDGQVITSAGKAGRAARAFELHF